MTVDVRDKLLFLLTVPPAVAMLAFVALSQRLDSQLLLGLLGALAIALLYVSVGAERKRAPANPTYVTASGERQGVPVPVSDGSDDSERSVRTFQHTFTSLRDPHTAAVRYQLLWARTPDMLFWLDVNNLIIDANAAAGEGFHVAPAELLGLNMGDLCAPESVAHFSESLALARTAGHAAVESSHVFKDGIMFCAEATITSIEVDSDRAVLVVLRDTTERKRSENLMAIAYQKALDSSRFKSEFVATMSHEIRSPMNAVIGMNELLLDTALSEEQREYTESVQNSSLALLGIIDDILDFSKIEAKGLKLETIEMNMPDTIESAASLFAVSAQRKGICLMTYIDPQVPRIVSGDPMRLRQVLVNLIGNAVKFTKKGGVVVTVTCRTVDNVRSQLRFAVKDSGIGIDDATAEFIFEPFRQADGSTTRNYGGTGLGLSISRRLVELMGGTLVLESTPGFGSEFAFTADFARHNDDAQAIGPSVKGLRVIIVDDERSAQEILYRYMVDWEMSATVASSAAEALAMMREQAAEHRPYDLAIIDYAMPETTGIELADEMKADDVLKNVRLIMVTAYDGAKRGEAAIAAGFSCYLPKPVRRSQLFECVVEAVRAHDAAAVTLLDRRSQKRPFGDGTAAERSERLLLVEDQPVNQKLVVQQLKKLGFAAHAVSNGQKAISALAYEHYDLVLMDCQMPLMNGFDATRTIRKMELHTGRHIPIIAMTANARPEDREECLAAGMDDYLAKPVLLEQLRAKCAEWLPPRANQSAALATNAHAAISSA